MLKHILFVALLFINIGSQAQAINENEASYEAEDTTQTTDVLPTSISKVRTPLISRLEQAFRVLENDPQARYALASMVVLDAKTGQRVFAKNENIGLATASTLKVITSATAFSILGKEFSYQTTLAYSGAIGPDGVLNGNLIIIGGGDPTLGSWRYEQTKENVILSQWVTAIKAAGIKSVNGAVIGDDRLWGNTSLPEGWIWQDMGNYYGAAPSALSWRENQFDVHLKPGPITGSPVSIVKTVPAMPYLKIINELKTGPSGSGDKAYNFMAPLATIGYLRGSWGIGINKSGVSLALPDPALDAAYRLQDTLKRLGIVSSGLSTTARQLSVENKTLPAVTAKLATVTSPNLSQIIYWFNKKSINLYGEHLIRTLAWKAGKEATTPNGVVEMLKYWSAKGIDKNALNIVDGSGLSPATRVTTAAMASILFQAQKESWYPDYLKSLPIINGMTIKSGSIADVQAYAGYYTAANGNKYIVVININNYSGGKISNKLFKVLNVLK
jgi:D-alanyl-D-alanine carboxypeptidase/D-alanyl-D-alanine-endopeptidase (penicillin-binding protein 4)